MLRLFVYAKAALSSCTADDIVSAVKRYDITAIDGEEVIHTFVNPNLIQVRIQQVADFS